MEKEYSRMQVEDKALKSAAVYFGQELLPYLKIKGKIKRLLPTEQIRLEAVRSTEDILFEMEDGRLTHFEFESVEVTEDDLRRFHVYDAYTELHYKKSVTTYVICSGKVWSVHSELVGDLNTYRIIPLRMKQADADKLLTRLKRKRKQGKKLRKKDLAPLLLAPLMNGASSIKDRILEAEKLIKSEQADLADTDVQRMEAVLYAFACKFLEKKELDEVKEELCMTVLGEMIWNDGLVVGRVEGRIYTLIEQACRKLQKDKTIEQIAEELDEDLTQVESICNAARQCAPDYDCEKIYKIWKTTNQN